MRIGINIEPLVEEKFTGVQFYTLFLLKYLFSIDKKNQYFLFSPGRLNFSIGEYDNVRIVSFGLIKSRIRWRIFVLPYLVMRYKIDVFHSLNYYLPNLFLSKAKRVVTIHDICFCFADNFYDSTYNDFLKEQTSCSIKKADIIITVSNKVKADIVKVYNIPESKMRTVYNGISNDVITPYSQRDNVLKKYNLQKDYLVNVGMLGYKKNHINIVKAYSSVSQKLRNIDVDLVIIGSRGYKSELVDKLISDSSLNNKVHILEYVPRPDAIALMKFAKCLVFPSKCEGFGLPILEAFLLGVPVITSSTTATKEVAGDACVLVDPNNVDEISRGMTRVLSDEKLCSILVKKGRERAKQFTWEQSAKQVLKVYSELG